MCQSKLIDESIRDDLREKIRYSSEIINIVLIVHNGMTWVGIDDGWNRYVIHSGSKHDLTRFDACLDQVRFKCQARSIHERNRIDT